MVSIVSAVSVNLFMLVSATPDSARASTVATTVAGTSVTVPVSSRGIAATAARYLGTRYRLGGVKPGAFDCSGFVRYVFSRHGIALPRTAREQATAGRAVVVGVDSLHVGDLLFFHTKRGRASHVAMYAGNGRIIHASSGSRRIRYDDLGSPRGRWFIEHLSSVRRVMSPDVDGSGARPEASQSEMGLLRSLSRVGG
jgi:cell wall-associated NlpC family hydrolase